MILIEEIHISHFRGIKELSLNLAKERFGVFGPNGTGKSGVVDAIEFALTGSITRLSGAGTDELSVAKHGPHVDEGAGSSKAVVCIEGVINKTGTKFKIERSVDKLNKPTIVPNDDVTNDVIAEIERHPEFALSRRDIVKYIITPAGKRDEDVKALLRLDRLDTIRKSLTTISNKYSTKSKQAESTANSDKEQFAVGLSITDTEEQSILSAINEHRKVLKLKELTKLTAKSNFKDGIKEGGIKKPPIPKTAAQEETLLLLKDTSEESEEIMLSRSDASTSLSELRDDTNVWRTARQSLLVEAGLPLIDENGCPLCDTQWDESELREHLEQKLHSASSARQRISTISELSLIHI